MVSKITRSYIVVIEKTYKSEAPINMTVTASSPEKATMKVIKRFWGLNAFYDQTTRKICCKNIKTDKKLFPDHKSVNVTGEVKISVKEYKYATH